LEKLLETAARLRTCDLPSERGNTNASSFAKATEDKLPLKVLSLANQNSFAHTFKAAKFISKPLSRATYSSYIRAIKLASRASGKPEFIPYRPQKTKMAGLDRPAVFLRINFSRSLR
jgi:hypothetical protein